MRVFAGCVVALCLIASPAMARANGDGGNTANSPAPATNNANASSSAPAKPETVTTESDLQQLKDLIEAQSKQLQEQQQELNDQRAEMEALKQQLSSTSAAGVVAAPIAATPAAIGPVVGVSTAPAAVSSATPAVAAAVPQTNDDQPAALHYKGITLTPGGFAAAETVWRQKAMASDVNTPFNSVPFNGASQAHMSEFNASGRQSRISMLMQGKLANVSIGSYYEADFLSAGTTSNNNQSNSYTLRQRQFWGQAAFTNGITITGGQQWSLITETANGMDNRTENLPMTIDAQYHAGFSWARQYGLRFVKNFSNKVWLGMSVEASQATLTVHGNPTVNNGGTTVCTNAACTTTALINPTVNNNFLVGAFGTSGGLYNPAANYQFNPAPDVIVKAVFQPGFGHYEVFGIVSQFRDRVFPCVPITGTTPPAGCSSITSAAGAYNYSATGGGAGANARWTVLKKRVDFGVHFFGGDGIGRYGSVGLSDATTRPDGTLSLLHNFQGLGTLQLHPTPKWDIYFNVGSEYSARGAYAKPGAAEPNEGYGAIGFANSGCSTETLPVTSPSTSSNTGVPTGVGGSTGFIPGALSNCTGDTRSLTEGTVGFWYRFYNGPMGRVQFGMQYSSYVRQTWDGNGGTVGAAALNPAPGQNMWFTSFRYYLP